MFFVCNALILNVNIFISMDLEIFSSELIGITMHNHGAEWLRNVHFLSMLALFTVHLVTLILVDRVLSL